MTSTSLSLSPELVGRFMEPEASDEEHEIAFQEIFTTIAQDCTVLLNLIMSLQCFLTSEEEKERNKATLLLAKLLEMQQKPLSASQIHHFCVFFNSRMGDYPSLAPCLRAIRGIVQHQWEHFDEKYMDVADIFDAVFKELEVQDLPQSIRSRVFDLLITLLSCSMVVATVTAQADGGVRVIQGVLDAVEGEKDPRCLVQCFRLIAQLYSAFPPSLFLCMHEHKQGPSGSEEGDASLYEGDLNMKQDSPLDIKDNDHLRQSLSTPSILTHGERIFNIMACYFPITFTPPPNDPYGITPAMLIQSLKHALCDNTHVSTFVVPFLLDQLLAPAETVCRSHAIFYLHYLVKRHAHCSAINNFSIAYKRSSDHSKGKNLALPQPLLLLLIQLSEALYDIALEDTTSLPVLSIDRESDDMIDGFSTTASHSLTLTDQAIGLIGLICKQIGTSTHQGELAWAQFGEPILVEIVKSTRKSVQNMITKANMKVALAMAGSTYKITSTLIDRLLPVLLLHVRPVLQADLDQYNSTAVANPELLLPHDLERKNHDKNSAAVGLMYLAQLLSCTLVFDLNFSQYNNTSRASSSDSGEGAGSDFDELFDLLCRYIMAMFQLGSGVGSRVYPSRSSVGLYAGCLKCLQSLVAIRQSNRPGTCCDQEQYLLQQVVLNCFVVRGTEVGEGVGYDWSADIRQASVLYVSQCRNLYLKTALKENATSSSAQLNTTDTSADSNAHIEVKSEADIGVVCSFDVFEEGCLVVMRDELSSDPSPARLHHIFHTISHLLQPFSARGGGGRGEDGGEKWSTLDNQLLSILLDCITSSTQEQDTTAARTVQIFALEALVHSLPYFPSSSTAPSCTSAIEKSEAQQNYIVNSLATTIEEKKVSSSGEDSQYRAQSNFQKLVEFAVGPSCDEGSLALVCQIVHRVLACLSASSSDSAERFKPIVEKAIQTCIQALLYLCPPATSVIFPISSLLPEDNDVLKSPAPVTNAGIGSKHQAARVLISILNVLNKDCWVWEHINAIGKEESDTDPVHLWTQFINVVCSNVILCESVESSATDKTFTQHCAHLLAILLNKSAAGDNLEILLCALDSLLSSCNFSSTSSSCDQLSLPTRESGVQVLVLIVRALMMRRNVSKTQHTPSDASSSHCINTSISVAQTWQEHFLQVLLSVLLVASAENSSSSGGAALTLALVAKHMHLLSSESNSANDGKEGCGFLSSVTSNTTSLMWRQKLWHQCLPVLTTAVQQATALSGSDKISDFTCSFSSDLTQPIAALLCLCSLAAEMPLAVVQEHLPVLITFSIQALMVNEPLPSPPSLKDKDRLTDGEAAAVLGAHVRTYLRHAAVQCLLSACQSSRPEVVKALEPHLTTLVPLLLQGAQADSRGTLAATRGGCVQSLFFLAGGDMRARFDYHSLHPLKRVVVRGLSVVLNDKKQSVRRWAAKVRNLWIALKE